MFKEHEETGDTRLIENTTFTHNDMFIGFVTDDKEEHDRLINEEHDNIACANRSIIDMDAHAINDTNNFFQVDNYPEIPQTDHKLKSHNMSCSWSGCASETTSECFSIRSTTEHSLRLKRSSQAKTNEELQQLDMSKLAIDQLKTDLLFRGLSTTHKVKSALVQRLTSFLRSEESERTT